MLSGVYAGVIILIQTLLGTGLSRSTQTEGMLQELKLGESRAILDEQMMEACDASADAENSSGAEAGGEDFIKEMEGKEANRMRLEKRLLSDVPLQIEDKR